MKGQKCKMPRGRCFSRISIADLSRSGSSAVKRVIEANSSLAADTLGSIGFRFLTAQLRWEELT
jgi:hypothetical protein